VDVGGEFGDLTPTPPQVQLKQEVLTMVWPFNKDEMGDARDYVAENCKEGVDPRSAIEDWGDYDEDHNRTTDDDGISYASAEEVQEYYESANDRRDFRFF